MKGTGGPSYVSNRSALARDPVIDLSEAEGVNVEGLAAVSTLNAAPAPAAK